jgi:hypothetical protein
MRVPYILNITIMNVHNDLTRVNTELLGKMIDSFLNDFGRTLSKVEYLKRKRTLLFLQLEMDVRKRSITDLAV